VIQVKSLDYTSRKEKGANISAICNPLEQKISVKNVHRAVMFANHQTITK
jgi:hypothetical protein